MPGLGEFFVEGDDAANEVVLAAQHGGLVVFGEVASFPAQGAEDGVAFDGEGVEPGEGAPDLEVAQGVGAVECGGLGGVFRGGVAQLVEFAKTGEGVDEAGGVAEEEVFKEVALVGVVEVCGGLAGEPEAVVIGFSGGVFLDLDPERGHDVDGAADVGEFLQDEEHTEVVFDGVEADPGEGNDLAGGAGTGSLISRLRSAIERMEEFAIMYGVQAGTPEPDERTREQLKALGYVK